MNADVCQSKSMEVRDRQDSASAEMLAIIDSTRLAAPMQSVSRATTPDLFPDSMESRVVGSSSRALSPSIEDLSLDRMSSRIERREMAV
jgi:hypothetical protein